VRVRIPLPAPGAQSDNALLNTFCQAYENFIERAGVPRIRCHDLRHTSATLQLVNAKYPMLVQERRGHTGINEMRGRNSHVSADMQRGQRYIPPQLRS
jgi:integrase